MDRRAFGSPSWAPIILAFFAGISLLTLVLTVNLLPFFAPSPLFPPEVFATFHLLWGTLLGLLVVVSILGILATMSVTEGETPRGSALDRFGRLCFLVVLVGFLAVVTLFLLEFSGNDAALFVILEIGFVALFLASYVKRPGSRRPPTP